LSPDRDAILLLLPSLTGLGGGIELYLRQFLEALIVARPNARLVAVLAREPSLKRPELLSPALRARLKVVGASSDRRTLRIGEFVARAALEAARCKPVLVVCGHVNYAVVSHGLARTADAHLVMLTYGVEAWNVAQPLTARAMKAADRIIAISAFTASQLMRSLDVTAGQISIVQNAVDVERFSPGTPSPIVVAKLASLPRPRLLTVCRLDASEAYKGVDLVTRALAAHPEIARSYLVVGEGTDRPRLERLAHGLGVPVTFYGRAPDDELADLYRACDLFVMPSRKEGFGYVFIEAMACGLPVVAGGVDGSVDALAGGALGLLVNPLDPEEIAQAVQAQLSGATPASMRDPAVLHAEVARRFSPSAFARKLDRALP
jgi:phosphatidylinositol alpha-1,6-mannosyltransferase